MKFDFLSITGADDQTDRKFIFEITNTNPCVEWGILFADGKEGRPRYPSREWLQGLHNDFYIDWNFIAFAAHLCGPMGERAIRDGGTSFLDGELFPYPDPKLFGRIQLNVIADMPDCSNSLLNTMASRLRDVGPDPIDIILQIPDEKTLVRCQHTFLNNVVFLHDASRGRGKVTTDWPEPGVEGYIGYAGGINPENIRAVLDNLCERDDPRHFWLDLESGARTDDRLDYRKVEELLKIAHEYIHPESANVSINAD
jgi:hypothetical protein